MLTTLEAVVRRLVEAYEPERIILFGSRAREAGATDADFDLLVVKDTIRRPLDRRMEVERVLADRAVALDLTVYTPNEMRGLYAQGSPFITEVLATGKVLYMRDATSAWLHEVENELAMGQLLLEHQMFRGACLHAQQAVEKGLKALLIERAETVPRTHDLIDLTRRVAALGWTVPLDTDEIVFLNSVYRGRYPTEEGLLPHGDPTSDEASTAVRGADTFVAFLRSALGRSRDAGPAHPQAAPTPSKGGPESHSSVTGPEPGVESQPPSGRREP